MMTSLLRHGLGQAGVATDKRFRRAHVKPSRKRSSASTQLWFALKLLMLVARCSVTPAYWGVTLIAAAPSLQIGHMVVRGHERLSTGEVLALVDGLRGQNILAVSLDDLSAEAAVVAVGRGRDDPPRAAVHRRDHGLMNGARWASAASARRCT